MWNAAVELKTASLVAAAFALVACQEELGPRAKQILAEAEAKQRGETWPSINQENYDQLVMGISYEEAASLLGPGEEASQSDVAGQSIVIYQWVRPDGGNINLTFSNDSLVSKAQAGLYQP